MALFIISTIIFVLFAIAFPISIALWVYEDAKVKSDQAPVLWLLIVLVGNIFGFLIYMLAGRTKKDVKAPGKFKGFMIAMLIGFILSSGLFTAGLINLIVQEGFSVTVGTFMSSRNRLKEDVWTFRARSANGYVRRTINFSTTQLANFRVQSHSGEGLTLRLEQDNIVEIINISGTYNERVDMSAFSPGKIRIYLEFDRARDADVILSWK